MEPVITSIFIGLTVSIVGGLLINWVKTRSKSNQTKKQEEENKMKGQELAIIELQKEIWKLRKTTLIIAKILDDQTNKNHPELTSSLEDIATELLRQSDKG